MSEALRLHADAARRYRERASALSEDAWLAPRAEGKWSPAEITAHLVKSYDAVLPELAGGAGMRVVTRPFRRLLLRFLVLPWILRTGRFPSGARAPREARPAEVETDRDRALAAFTARAEAFDRAAREVAEADPPVRLTHAYFGQASLENGILLCARHVLHHEGQLPR